MTRNVEKIINDYDMKYSGAGNRCANLYTTEMQALKDMSEDLFNVIANTFKFAYMVGYKAGKRTRR